MSTTETSDFEVITDEAPIVRTFTAELEQVGDGRTLEGRIVPYNTPTMVADEHLGVGYMETFLPGVFDRNLKAANRVLLNFEHDPSLRGVIGRGLSLNSANDGLYGTFKVYDNADGNKALEMYHDGILRALSLQAKPIRSVRTRDGTVQRVKAHLDAVALAREGAYEQAKVLAVRSKQQLEELALPAFDLELAASLERFVQVPVDLSRLGRTFTMAAWDGSPGRWPSAAAYCQSCAIDDNPAGKPKTKALCHLPYKEPGGAMNVNAIRNALARVDQVQTSDANKAAARTKLERLLNQFNSEQGS